MSRDLASPLSQGPQARGRSASESRCKARWKASCGSCVVANLGSAAWQCSVAQPLMLSSTGALMCGWLYGLTKEWLQVLYV